MEVAALGLRVDGIEGIDRASTSLDGLAASGVKAEKSVSGVGRGAKASQAPIDALAASSAKAAAAEARLAAQAEKAGMSVNAMRASLRGVPAQFTDIAVSLQGGMNPLTVFLQQGGQLKDMFGGAGTAARVLARYVVGLINPFSVAAAAVATLGVAYYNGSREIDAFRNSLVTTGNATGNTVGQLQAYALQISEVVGTQGKAAESLALFINAGVRGDQSLKQFTQTAIQWEKATGEGVDSVAQKFAALQKDPVNSALKLNETTNFLTKSVYEQIVSLEGQGRTLEASQVAMQALDSAMKDGAKNIEQNLGSIERGWNSITGAAKMAWDAMLSIGRQASLMDQLATQQQRLLDLETQTVGLYERGTYKKRLDDQRARVTSLMDEVAAEEASAAGKKEAARQVAASAAWGKITTKNLSDEAKLRNDLAEVQRKGIEAGADENEILAIQNKMREDYAKKNKPKKEATVSTAGVSELASIMARVKATNDYVKALQEQGKAADKITEGEKLASKIQGEIDSGRLKGSQLVQKQKELEAAKMLQASGEQLQLEEKRIELVEKAKKAEIDRQNTIFDLEERLQSQRGRQEAELSSYGMGSRAASELQGRIQLQQDHQRQLSDMRKQFGEESRKSESDAEAALIEGMFNERLALTQSGFAKELALYDKHVQDKRLKDKDWESGWKSALETYVENSNDQYKLAADFATSSLNSITNAFSDMVMTGKLDMRSLASSVIAQLVKISVQALITRAAMSFIGFMSPASAPAAIGAGSVISGGVSGLAGMAHDGIDNVPQTGTWLLQKGERVTTSETSKKLDNTLERIDARGRSSVGGGTMSVTVPVSISMQGQVAGGQQDPGSMERVGSQISKAIRPAVQEEVARMMRPGGLLWNRG